MLKKKKEKVRAILFEMEDKVIYGRDNPYLRHYLIARIKELRELLLGIRT